MFFFVQKPTTKTNVVLVFKDDEKKDSKIKRILENNLLTGDLSSYYLQLEPNKEGNIYIGLGKKEYNKEDLIQAGFNIYNKVKDLKLDLVYLDFNHIISTLKDRDDLLFILEGMYHASYHFDLYLKEKKTREINFQIDNSLLDLVEKLDELKNVMLSNFWARNLINTPSIDLYPESYVERIKEEFKDLPLEVEVFDENQMFEKGMHAALAVGMGSDRKPRFIVIKYQPNPENNEFIGLVGKGICYDSGGYAIKPDYGMVTMRRDMAGSAIVLATLRALALNRVKENVVCTVALCENLISGSAYKNGDIISSLKGLTIEVNNTDAEGRVSMADSLYYVASQFNTTKIVEMSTLTGAIKVALGFDTAGAISFDENLYNQLYKSSKEVFEPIWNLPITQRTKDYVKGKFADLSNSSPGPGAITAGVFLSHFVENKPFVHIDIAGTAYDSANKYYNEGATGFGVKLLYNFIKNNQKGE